MLGFYTAPGIPQKVEDTFIISALKHFPAVQKAHINNPYFLENIGMSGNGCQWADKLLCALPNLNQIEINQECYM